MTNDVINNLCERFGVTVEYLMPRLIAYYRVDAVMGVIASVATIVAGIIMYAKTNGESIGDSFVSFTTFLFGLGFTVGGAVALLVTLTNVIQVCVAPEAYVIQELISKVR